MPQQTNEISSELIFSNNKPSLLNIIHFNDVYNIESNTTEPKAGAARFLTAINQLRDSSNPTLILFSGDAFSPSAISLITKGKQMVTCLNKFGVHAACIGNHDFDFGVEVLVGLIKETNFPWMISNVLDVRTKKPLADGQIKTIINVGGIKIGLVGLVELEWIETLSTLGYEDVIYESFVTAGIRLAKELKQIDKCDLVIALTHMRMPNDVKLAKEVEEIDLVLGGHDHNYMSQYVNNKWILKSGTDFRNLSLIQLDLNGVNKIEKYVIDSRVEEDPDLKEIVEDYLQLEDKAYDMDVLASVNVDLDSRFTVIRTQESNICNLLCDILLDVMPGADCCIVNSGTFRSDCINPASVDFTLGDLKKIMPFADQIVMLQCTGKILHETLENSVSSYPKLEGRFPQISGIKFTFDASKPSFKRIDAKSIQIKGNPLDPNKDYKLVVKAFMKEGKDGFNMLCTCPVLIDQDQTPLVFTIVENYFRKNRFHNENFAIEPKIEQRIVCIN